MLKFCGCGCGEEVKTKGRYYKPGHNPNSKFNIEKGRDISHTKGRKRSEEFKKKISNSLIGNRYACGNTNRRGKKHTEESKTKNRIAHIGKMFGENHPQWRGGVSSLNRSIRRLYENIKWRSKVFQRDNWTCQTCQKRGVYLEAHHIKEFATIIKENNIKSLNDARNCQELWDINNGVTLCKDCHNLTKMGRYK